MECLVVVVVVVLFFNKLNLNVCKNGKRISFNDQKKRILHE